MLRVLLSVLFASGIYFLGILNTIGLSIVLSLLHHHVVVRYLYKLPGIPLDAGNIPFVGCLDYLSAQLTFHARNSASPTYSVYFLGSFHMVMTRKEDVAAYFAAKDTTLGFSRAFDVKSWFHDAESSR